MRSIKILMAIIGILMIFGVFTGGEDRIKNPDSLDLPATPVDFTSWLSQDIRINTGVDPGTVDVGDEFMACQGDYIYVAFKDGRFRQGSRNGRDVFFTYSADRGATWLKNPIRLNNGTERARDYAYHPQVAVSEEYVYVCWKAEFSQSKEGVFFNYSSDHGKTWQSSHVRIDHNKGNLQYLWGKSLMAVSGNKVYLVWADTRNRFNDPDIFFNYSNDNGATWQSSDIQLNSATGGWQDDPSIVCSGDNVYVTWEDVRSGRPKVYFNASHDGGKTWLPSDKQINRNTNRNYICNDAEIACSGDKVYVVWEDTRNGSRDDIYFNYSKDGGLTWKAEDIRLDTNAPAGANSKDPEIVCSGDSVYVAWEDGRYGDTVILFNHSNDGGKTWAASDLRLSTNNPGIYDQEDVAISCNGQIVHAVWDDSREGRGEDVFYNYSTDGGITWQASDMKLNNTPGDADIDDPQVCSTPEYVAVIWDDERNSTSNEDVYFNRVNHPPVANAGADFSTTAQLNTPFDGTKSNDPNGDRLSYKWSLISAPQGSSAALKQITTSTPSLKPDLLGNYTLKLTVSDPFGRQHSDKVVLTAMIPPPVNFKGERVTNRSLSQTEIIDVLTWQVNPTNYTLTGYVIYRVNNDIHSQLAEVGADTFLYLIRNIFSGDHTYAVRAKDSQGNLSTPVLVTVAK